MSTPTEPAALPTDRSTILAATIRDLHVAEAISSAPWAVAVMAIAALFLSVFAHADCDIAAQSVRRENARLREDVVRWQAAHHSLVWAPRESIMWWERNELRVLP